MRSLEALWRKLEAMPVRSGVRRAWQDLAGEHLPILEPYLRIRDAPATSFPCDEPDEGCPRRIVVHPEGEIVAVCGAEVPRCETLSLTKADIAVYDLDLHRMGSHIAAVLGLSGDLDIVAGIPDTFCLGAYMPYAGRAFPAYMTAQHDTNQLNQVVEQLIARAGSPFILFTPTPRSLASCALAAMTRGKVISISLSQIMTVKNGELSIGASGDELFASLREQASVPESGKAFFLFFPTPPGATWNGLKIRLVDGHTLTAKVQGISQRLNYTDMGMANRKNQAPTLQWQLLTRLAERHGALPKIRGSGGKQRQELRRRLKDFFRIDGDPFDVSPDGTWRARFQIEGE